MQRMKKIAIIPAYNEEISIGSVVQLAKKYVDAVLVVDDGSTDKTGHIASLSGANLITLEKNSGKANAIFCGISASMKMEPDILVFLDADGQHDADEIPLMMKPIENKEADVVLGSRYLQISDETPKYRRIGQKSLDAMTNIGTGNSFSDTQCGFRAFGKKAFPYLNFKSDRYSLESDMLKHFSLTDLRIKEVSITVKYDVPHKHKEHPLIHGVSIFSNLIATHFIQHPFFTLGLPGIGLFFMGVIIGVYALSLYEATAIFPISYSLVSLLSLIMGSIFITSAITQHSVAKILEKNKLI